MNVYNAKHGASKPISDKIHTLSMLSSKCIGLNLSLPTPPPPLPSAGNTTHFNPLRFLVLSFTLLHLTSLHFTSTQAATSPTSASKIQAMRNWFQAKVMMQNTKDQPDLTTTFLFEFKLGGRHSNCHWSVARTAKELYDLHKQVNSYIRILLLPISHSIYHMHYICYSYLSIYLSIYTCIYMHA